MASIKQTLDLTSSIAASQARLWAGTGSSKNTQQPEKLLALYEYEISPYCRLVRETLTELDLDAIIYPCPQGGKHFRPQAIAASGKKQFPFLVDPNTGAQLLESADIIDYLHRSYTQRTPPSRRKHSTIKVPGSVAASALRYPHGLRAKASRAPDKLLELFSFESSPYSRPVRELLCELEIPYILRNMGKAHKADMGPPFVRTRWFAHAPVRGRNRKAMFEMTGRLQVPYLIDPNTGVQMYESAEICSYLNKTYGA